MIKYSHVDVGCLWCSSSSRSSRSCLSFSLLLAITCSIIDCKLEGGRLLRAETNADSEGAMSSMIGVLFKLNVASESVTACQHLIGA